MKKLPKITRKIDSTSLQANKIKGVVTSEESYGVFRNNEEDVKKLSRIACLEQHADVFKLNRKSLLSVIGNKLNLSMLSAFK
ncbi:hypothetical protein KL866_07460 [Alteromonas sp. ALT199]|uniref:hypothetical protein n=1 Tax=unclassified Alteromonas TaxID=2614992 RepID=UPI000446BA14|nr:hypothetical protein [Alteromonas sp. ALT199]MBT3134940.1 hypothetical protein [Alteromonas sp. ALT199]